MAKSVPNASTGNLKGRIGDLVYYKFHGEPCVRGVPHREDPPTPPEEKNRSRFRAASKFGQSTLTDPEQKARYAAAAARTGSTAYNVAVSDFMHCPVITEVDLTAYTGRAGQIIRMRVEEKKIGAVAVGIRIEDDTRTVVLEEGMATVADDGFTWSYTALKDSPPDRYLWITITAQDQPRNRTAKTVRHMTS